MTEIKTNIIHLKTYLHDLERECDNLIVNKVKSSAPKARAIAQKMKLIMIELRKDIQKNAAEVPVKKRVKKAELEEVAAVVEAAAVQQDEVPIEQTIEPVVEQTIEPPKTVKKRKTRSVLGSASRRTNPVGGVAS